MKRNLFIFKILIFLFLFSSNNLFAQQWLQLGQDIDGIVANEYFGHSVSLSSDGLTVVIGTKDKNLVRIYHYNGTSWVQMGSDITGSGNFGASVSISGNGKVVAMGAPYNTAVKGRVVVYEYNGTNWVQRGANIDGANGDYMAWYWGDASSSQDITKLGFSVSLNFDGTTLAMGDTYTQILWGSGYGKVLVMRFNGTNWQRKGYVIVGGNSNRDFGYSLSLSNDGNSLAVGDPARVVTASSHGEVSVYGFNGTNWVKKGASMIASTQERAIGISVALSADGNTVGFGSNKNGVIGSYFMDCGSAHVYTYSGGVWIQKGQTFYGDGVDDYFGFSVSLSDDGNVFAVGSSNYDGAGSWQPGLGQTNVYKYGGASWLLVASSINGENLYDNAYAIGQSVSLSASGDTIAIGCFNNDDGGSNAGHVRVFYLGTPLPIELLNFTGEHTNNANQLQWTTATETNNDYFTLERSIDAENWEVVAIIDGAGNSNQKIEYTYEDYGFKKGINYYRLKQTDFDGTETYSKNLSIEAKTSELYFAYYNSQQDNIQIFLPNTEEENNIQLIDYTGKIIHIATIVGEQHYTISENLSQGIYVLLIYNKEGIQYKKKIFSK